MTTPASPADKTIPVLTEVVRLNDSLRPAIIPWQMKNQVQEVIGPGYVDQDVLADKVIERVQNRIAKMMPDLLRESVDQVLKEHELEKLKKISLKSS